MDERIMGSFPGPDQGPLPDNVIDIRPYRERREDRDLEARMAQQGILPNHDEPRRTS